MKKSFIVLSIIIFVFGFSGIGFCADSFKIGIINFQQILDESSAGKIVKKQLEKKSKEFNQKLFDEKKALDEIKKKIEQESQISVLTPEKKQKRQKEFETKVKNFNKMQQNLNRQFKQLEMKLFNEMQKQVFNLTEDIGKREQYQLIIAKKTAGIIYNQDALDITDQIIKEYNLIISKTD